MKIFWLMVLATATAVTAHAGSGTNATHQLSVSDIYSDTGVYDGKANTATYQDNVRVLGPDLKLSCVLLVADISKSGGGLEHVVAETNVVLDATNVVVDPKDPQGKTVHVTSQKAVYNFNVQDGVTNETITLTGNPQPQALVYQGTTIATNSADVIIYDRVNKSLRFQGSQHLQFYSQKSDAALAATTSQLITNKMSMPSGADTNYPPGSLDVSPPGGSPGGGGGRRGGF